MSEEWLISKTFYVVTFLREIVSKFINKITIEYPRNILYRVERGYARQSKHPTRCNSIDVQETEDIHLPWQSLFASLFPPRRVSCLSSLLIRSRFAIYHRSINLCRDSISTPPTRLSFRRQCFPFPISLPAGYLVKRSLVRHYALKARTWLRENVWYFTK